MALPRTLVLASAALAIAGIVAVIAAALPPSRVWWHLEPGGGAFDVRDAPDGREVPHAATMSAPDAAWAYYYPRPGWALDVRQMLSLRSAVTVDFVATGRTATTASGTWVEMRRCGEAEFAAALARPPAR